MAETGSPNTPARLTQIAGGQALGALAETFVFGFIGAFFGLLALLLFEMMGTDPLIDYLFSRPELQFYFLASGLIFVAILTAVRTESELRFEETDNLHTDSEDTRFDEIYENIIILVVNSSYVISVIAITAILTYELVNITPIFGMASIVIYPYFEHYAVVQRGSNSDSDNGTDSILTPAFVLTSLVALVPITIMSPVLLILRVLGIVASFWSYLPALSELVVSIQQTQEHLVFVDWFITTGRRRIH
jgi:hypothetical protein